jgi:Uma2 family endonuclease
MSGARVKGNGEHAMSVVAGRRTKQKSTHGSESSLRAVLPRQGEWTETQYLALTDPIQRHIEFTDGVIEVLPMPTDKHQGILEFLYLVFRAFLLPRGGKVRMATLRLQLRLGLFRCPDLLMLRDAKDRRRQDRYWTGADVVLEVVSKDNPRRDLIQKKREYAAAGFPEYWIVNPLNETIIVYVLEGKRYKRHGLFRRGQTATSATLADFSVDVNAVFDAD